MALQVRRGTNAERLQITPAEGELIYTVDTKQLYVGDGTTAGGNASIAGTIDSLLADSSPQLGGTLDLNNNDITGTGNINITGTIQASGNINLGDGVGSDILVIGGSIQGHLVPDVDATHHLGSPSKYWNNAWLNQLTVDSQITAERIQADLIADDSTVVFNAATGQIAAAQLVGTFTGNVVGDTQGHHVGTVDGDLSGSVFADDSTLIIDAQNRRFTGTINGTTRMNSSDETEVQLTLESLENTSKINLRRESATSLAGNTSLQYGTISFGREDTSGVLTTAIMFARENEFRIGQSSTGAFGVESVYITWKDNKLGLGKTNPAEQLDMSGNAIIDGFVQFGSLTTVERDALTAANGMVIYNSTDNKFQGYENGSWVNLI
jgi:hypothetical protein